MEFDKDLLARQEARQLLKAAELAQKQLADFSQSQLDAIVKAICDAIDAAAPELAQLAVRETGFGNVEDKITKNRFASRRVWEAVKAMGGRCAGGCDRGHRAQHQSHLYGVL